MEFLHTHTHAHKRMVTKGGGGRKQRPRALCSRGSYAKVVRARTSYRYKAFLGKLWSDLIICHLLSPHLHPFSKACFQVYNSFQGGGCY